MTTPPIDSVLLVGFGGPTKPDEIMPFLRNVVAGRGIPDERLAAVEAHYHAVGGRSPYNERTEEQRAGLESALRDGGLPLPVHVGMRNWDPYLRDTIRKMNEAGLVHTAGVILAPHRTEASHDRYLRDVERAVEENGGTAPRFTWIEPWYRNPRFLRATAARIEEETGHRDGAWPAELPVIFTAHSIPLRMPGADGYVEEVRASCEGVASLLGLPGWELAYQSRSGSPDTPWLEPDILDVLRRRASEGAKEVVVQAIGFLSDHMEVLYDLDVEARGLSDELGLKLHRAPCVNDHPEFIAMLAECVSSVARGAGR